MVLALRLANGGWWGGNPSAVLQAPADEVMNAVHYENFKSTYESQMIELAKQDSTPR